MGSSPGRWLVVAGMLAPMATVRAAMEAPTIPPGVVAVITGRIERNPPLFYEMRLDRAAARIRDDPTDLNAYDLAAEACDRLERSDEALAWMQRKRERLEAGDPADPGLAEHWYRYHSNVATFRVHRWARRGANPEHRGEVVAACEALNQALMIRPDAHFGREVFQLGILEWLIGGSYEMEHNPYLVNRPSYFNLDPGNTTPAEEAILGLAGLIALDPIWESDELFGVLTELLDADLENPVLGHMAARRGAERAEGQAHAIWPSATRVLWPEPARGIHSLESSPSEIAYRELRDEAKSSHERRMTYMHERLRAGRHPDTDPTFWDDFDDPGPPPLPMIGTVGQWFQATIVRPAYRGAVVAAVLAALAALIWLVKQIVIPRPRA